MEKKLFALLLCLCMVFAFCACGDSSSSDEAASEDVVAEEAVEETTAADPTAEMTTTQKNAYKAGLNYLDTVPFSKQGLIDQLSSEYGDGYEKEDAEFAVNAIEENGEVDWVEQAKKAAENYLDTMSFSKDGLIEQLESEYGDQYTHDQAVEAVEAVYQ